MVLPSGANIVILASNYNPSIVSKEWLYQKGIFTEAVRNFVHTPVFALVESEKFSLMVDEQKLQLTVKKVTQDNLNDSVSIVERFVGVLPETPYKAVGLNYRYTFPRERCDLGAILSANDMKLSELLSSTYELGATIIFEYEKFVVTLTVTPSLSKEQQIRMNFNFHSTPANVDEVKERLSCQMKVLEKTEIIIQGFSNNG